MCVQTMDFETITCVSRQWINVKYLLFFAQASSLLLILILIKFVNTLIYMMNENNVGTQYYLLNKQKTMGESVQLGFLIKLPIFVPQKAVTPKNGVELVPSDVV